MECKELESIMDKYLQGKLNTETEKAVEAHLESCTACRQSLDNKMETSAAPPSLPKAGRTKALFEPGLDERKQRSILRRAKYKNRFSIAVFLLLLLLGLRVAGGFLSSAYFNWGQDESRLYKAQRTAAILTEFTFPNVTLPISIHPLSTYTVMTGWGHGSLEIKPYFVARGNYAMQKQVGKEKVTIGQLNINHFFSSILTQWQWENDTHQDYLYFYHPGQLDFPRQIPVVSPRETWEALDTLPEGTVAELSLSFLKTYSIEEVMEMLRDYDLEITWYAVDTGLEKNQRHREHPEPLSAFRGAWGTPHQSRNMLAHYTQISSEEYSGVLEEYFLESMKYLLEHEGLTQKLYRGNPKELHLQERYKYIQANGIQVYGVVVTGPTKELLLLQELESIHSPALGEIQLWNWFRRNFEGTLY